MEPLNRTAFFKRNDAPASIRLGQVGWQRLNALAALLCLRHDLFCNRWLGSLALTLAHGLHPGLLLHLLLDDRNADVRRDHTVFHALRELGKRVLARVGQDALSDTHD